MRVLETDTNKAKVEMDDTSVDSTEGDHEVGGFLEGDPEVHDDNKDQVEAEVDKEFNEAERDRWVANCGLLGLGNMPCCLIEVDMDHIRSIYLILDFEMLPTKDHQKSAKELEKLKEKATRLHRLQSA
uniref:Uncharacterized protein n=1 Tax=Nelumbo nucifera TaxID=4432 RepID=A0A822ZNJ8_NELNU|nr:TPA_asm: hypothetical protein HUJ06_004593 [Nelumbo nucifera]